MKLLLMVFLPALAAAQLPAPPMPSPVGAPSIWQRLPVTASGALNVSSELYRHSAGSADRRPGASWRVSMSPRLQLFNEIGMGTEVLLSSEGSEFRQNMDQVGLNPSWRWATVHAGDFSRDYSSYTLTGTRLRGFGVDLQPGRFLFSVQGGQAQRTVSAGSDGAAYKRSMLAASLGYGRAGRNRIALTMLKAKDDPNSLEQKLVRVDTTAILDTALVADPLRFATTPQENLVVGIETELTLFRNMLRFKGQGGASLFTRDLRSQTVSDVNVGPLGGISSLQPLRLSTNADAAYEGELELRLSRFGLRGGYEKVGAGYTSLGLPYLINDRQGFHVGGNVMLFSNRLALQGDTRMQSNNLLGQKSARTDRSTSTLSAMATIRPTLSVATTVLLSGAASAKSDAAPGIDMRTTAVSSTITNRTSVMGRATALSVTYAFQNSRDVLPGSVIPGTTGNNVTSSITTAFSPTLSAGPSFSIVKSATVGQVAQGNALLGMTLRAKLLSDNRLQVNGNVSNTFSSGRQVRAMRAEAQYPVLWGTSLSVQARHTAYSRYASRAAFNESFLTMGITRSVSSR